MKKRKIAKMTGLLLAAVLLTGCFAGCSGGGDQNELIIGITYFAPMNYMEDGELTGFETEFATAVCEKLGMTPKFQEIKWESKETELNGNAIDCIWNGMSVDDDRLAAMFFAKPYVANRQIVIVPSDSDIKTVADLAGKKVVMFATHGGSGLGSSAQDCARAQPRASVTAGLAVRGTAVDESTDEIFRWARSLRL